MPQLSPKSAGEIYFPSHSGEMAALSNHYHLCDSPLGPPYPHLCLLPLPLYLSGTQEEADEVTGTLFDSKKCNFSLSRKVGGWVEQGEISFDLFWAAGR